MRRRRARRAHRGGARPRPATGRPGRVGRCARHRPARRRRGAAARASSTRTCTSTSPAAPSGRASTPATGAAAAGGVTTMIDMPLNSIPPTTTVDAPGGQARRCGRAGAASTSGSGAAPSRATSSELAALHDGGRVRLQVLPGRLRRARSSRPWIRAGLAAAMAETARLGALIIVHAEDAELIAAAPAPGGPRTRTFLRLPPARRRGAARSRACSARPRSRTGAPRARAAPVGGRTRCRMLRAARSDGVDVSVETCPALPRASTAEAIADGATQFKCCPPIREHDNRERLWAALAGGDDRHGRLRPLAVHRRSSSAVTPATSARPGAASRRCSSGCRSCGPRPAPRGPRPRRRGALDGERACRPCRAHRTRAGSRSAPMPTSSCSHPDAEFVVDPSRLRHRNPVSAYAGRRLTGMVRQTWLRGERVDPSSAARHGRS